MSIYAVAREPGGAEVLSLTLAAKPTAMEHLLIGKDYACSVYEKHHLQFIRYQGDSREVFFSFLDQRNQQKPVDLILTSAASLPNQDMTERYAWSWARKKGLPSIAVLDQWQNYDIRFAGLDNSNFLQALPDRICVMNELAAQALKEAGIAAETIVITGHPSLARFRRISQDSAAGHKSLRSLLSCGMNDRLILFISEPFSLALGDIVGFTEITILDRLFSYLSARLESEKNKTRSRAIVLVLKLHPKNMPEVFDGLVKKYSHLRHRLRIHLIRDEIDKTDLLSDPDLVIGMCSIMLMEAIAAGRLTVSVQIGAQKTNWCEAVNQEVIPLITSHAELVRVMDGLLDNSEFSHHYLDAIHRYPIIEDAENRIWRTIQEVSRTGKTGSRS